MARQSTVGSPTGSAAASSSNRCVSMGSCPTRRRKLASIRLGKGLPGTAKPPAKLADERPRGSSSKASGLPRASAMIRSRTGSSSGPNVTEATSSVASASDKPCSRSSGSPASSSPGTRAANTRPTDSATRRRATNPRTCADARSSHCASSTTQTSGCSSAASDSRLRVASAARKRSGADPDLSPNAVRNASRCGRGSRSRGPASAPAAGAPRRKRAPSPTGQLRHVPPGSPRRARPGSPAAPSCPRPVPRAPPAPDPRPHAPRRGVGRAGRIRGAGPVHRSRLSWTPSRQG
jgi:hypothetical protein